MDVRDVLKIGVVVASLAVATAACAPAQAPGAGTAAVEPAPAKSTQAFGGQGPDSKAKPGGVLKQSQRDDPPNLDPHGIVSAGILAVNNLTHNGLLRYTREPGLENVAKFKIAPELAEKWEIPNDRTYIFSLRKGVKFHNGDEFTAEDAVFSIKRIATPGGEFSRNYMFTEMESVEAVDKYTVKLTTKKPFAPMLGYIASGWNKMVSKKFTEANGGDLKRVNMGTGPFVFKEENYTRKVKMTLAKNPNYWEPGIPYLDAFENIYIPDAAKSRAAFAAKQVDLGGSPTPSERVAFRAENPDAILWEFPNDGLRWIQINITRKPLDDKRVRQAMAYAIDRKGIVDAVYDGDGTVNMGSLNATSIWTAPPDSFPTYKRDVAKAKQLLAEAGLSGGFTVKAMHPNTYDYAKDSYTVIQRWLQDIGVTLQFDTAEYGTNFERRAKLDYDISFLSSLAFADPDEFFGAWYREPYPKDAKLDELLEKQRATLDQEKRKAAIQEVQRYIEDMQFVITQPYPGSGGAWWPHTKNYEPQLSAIGDLTKRYIWLDR